MAERLQRILAAAGLGSRRACEQMILEGRVEVNGRTVIELPVLVEPGDRIAVDGRSIGPAGGAPEERKVYLMLHKPRGVVCTNLDPSGRTRAVDLVPGVRERVYPVGRLDADSSGLLLLTNDGELAHRLTHPRYEVPKTYEALVDGRIEGPAMDRLLHGVYLSEGKARADRLRLLGRDRQHTRLAITLTEDRNHQLRRMLARLGHRVRRLRRSSIGRLTLRGLGVGNFRPLTRDEVSYLRKLAGLARGSEEERGERATGRRSEPGRRDAETPGSPRRSAAKPGRGGQGRQRAPRTQHPPRKD